MRATEYFKLGLSSNQVSFVDVNVFRDNRLFIDPAVIRIERRSGSWATKADDRLIAFFDFILGCIHDPSKHAQGEAALSRFHEPRETRLGMSKAGFSGSGASSEIGHHIWASLVGNKLCQKRVVVLKRVQDIALFVSNVSDDRISDLTTRVIIEVLIDYTQQQMLKYPQMSKHTMAHEIQVWDAGTGTWTTATYDLPVVSKKGKPDYPLILVPKNFVHIGLRMSPSGFWSHGPITAVQADESTSVVVPGGKTLITKPRKKDLKNREDLMDIRPTNNQQTLRIWERDQTNLVNLYSQYIMGSYTRVTQGQMDAKIPK